MSGRTPVVLQLAPEEVLQNTENPRILFDQEDLRLSENIENLKNLKKDLMERLDRNRATLLEYFRDEKKLFREPGEAPLDVMSRERWDPQYPGQNTVSVMVIS